MSTIQVSAVVPTLGQSPLLESALRALRAQGRAALEIVVVASGPKAPPPSPFADRWLRRDEPLSFSSATNCGIAAARGAIIATINDDVVVATRWLEILLNGLEEHPQAGAVQGVNTQAVAPRSIDGCGLAWNDRWQAVQWLTGKDSQRVPRTPVEVFGVSATAALFRRRAFESLPEQDGGPFDEALGSYYEDVDLALRMRAAGWSAWLIPEARAEHSGSLSDEASGNRLSLVHRNRLLVLARLLGSSFWSRLPTILLRDLLDTGRELASGKPGQAARIARGVLSALRRLPRFARRGAPHVPLTQLTRFRVGS